VIWNADRAIRSQPPELEDVLDTAQDTLAPEPLPRASASASAALSARAASLDERNLALDAREADIVRRESPLIEREAAAEAKMVEAQALRHCPIGHGADTDQNLPRVIH
jgi:hypothetical protein